MVLIRCPRCGQRALSVATVCPRCGNVLAQNPMQQGAAGDLIECRRCGKLVPKREPVCPYCAYPAHRRRLVRRLFGALAGGVAVAGATVAALQLRPSERPSTRQEAVAAVPADEMLTETADTVDVPTDAPAVGLGPQPTMDAAQGSPEPPAGVPVAAARGLPTRWAVTWANVRQGRGTDTRVLQVLRPGDSVQVADLQRGWWLVYVAGEAAGYVAGDLLRAEPISP